MITELVCPEFYIDTWEKEGRKYTTINDAKVEFHKAADDGTCRLMRTQRVIEEVPQLYFVCRCGRTFKSQDAKHLEVR